MPTQDQLAAMQELLMKQMQNQLDARDAQHAQELQQLRAIVARAPSASSAASAAAPAAHIPQPGILGALPPAPQPSFAGSPAPHVQVPYGEAKAYIARNFQSKIVNPMQRTYNNNFKQL